MKRFTVLDSFRGICALCVVFHHFNITGSMTEWSLFRNATYMVEFFFVLSGFVLTHAYSKREFDWNKMRSFAVSRTFRLFPLHVFMLIVFILLELIKLIAQSKGVDFNKPAFTGVNAPIQILPNLLLLRQKLRFRVLQNEQFRCNDVMKPTMLLMEYNLHSSKFPQVWNIFR